MNSRNIFAYTLCGLVVIITIMSLLAVWDVVEWQYIQQYFGKTLKSLIIIAISAVVIYIIQSLLAKKEIGSSSSESSNAEKVH